MLRTDPLFRYASTSSCGRVRFVCSIRGQLEPITHLCIFIECMFRVAKIRSLDECVSLVSRYFSIEVSRSKGLTDCAPALFGLKRHTLIGSSLSLEQLDIEPQENH